VEPIRTLALALAVSTTAFSQTFQMRPTGLIGVEPTLRADPPSFPLLQKFTVLPPRSKGIPNVSTFYSRILLDNANHKYFGYEVLVEQQPSGDYLVTFGKPGITPLDLAGGGNIRFSVNQDGTTNLDWTPVPLPEIPKPSVVPSGTISIDLFTDPATGAKLIDDIRILPPMRSMRFQVPMAARMPVAAAPVPTVSGTARDFSPSDAELEIDLPRGVTLNGVRQSSIPLHNVHGPIVWLYVPEHGRYVFSLTAHPGLGFKKSGEVRGGVISLAVDGDAITLESPKPIAPGDAPYHLYVLHDPDWEPVAESQKSRPGLGSVSAAELTALKN
jgi:hypothetical protein